MKSNKKIRFWLFYHIGIALFSMASAAISKYFQTGSAFIPETILMAATVFFMSILIGYLAIFFVNKGSGLSHERLNKMVIPAFLIFLFGSVIISNVVVSLGVLIWFIIRDISLDGFISHLFKVELKYANSSIFIWLLSFSVAFFYVLWRKSARKEMVLSEENLKFRYKTLKSQVNPHFLFNSLNTLSEIIHADTAHADGYIAKLSSFYRYVIENEETELVNLSVEVNFAHDYFELQKERDDDKISLEMNIPGVGNYLVIPVSLQMLLENAFKHNVCSREHPLKIKINREDDVVVVSNNIQRKNTMNANTGTGLQNLAERVRLTLGREMVVVDNGIEFTVKLPVKYASV